MITAYLTLHRCNFEGESQKLIKYMYTYLIRDGKG